MSREQEGGKGKGKRRKGRKGEKWNRTQWPAGLNHWDRQVRGKVGRKNRLSLPNFTRAASNPDSKTPPIVLLHKMLFLFSLRRGLCLPPYNPGANNRFYRPAPVRHSLLVSPVYSAFVVRVCPCAVSAQATAGCGTRSETQSGRRPWTWAGMRAGGGGGAFLRKIAKKRPEHN